MANTFSNLLYHVIFSTKSREPLISDAWRDDLHAYIGGILRAEQAVLLEAGSVADHVHLLVKARPAMAIADLTRLVKANSSKWINERPDHAGRFAWQTGYSVFSVSESQVPAVRNYIRNQREHHRVKSYQEELTALLKKHGIEFDPRYLVD